MKINYLVEICFDGSLYSGWQIQPNASTIQAQIQKVLSKIFNRPIQVQGCSRTDKGVHAKAFYFHFHIDQMRQPLCKSMNALLPPCIRVLKITQVPMNFHARYSATSKIYEYNISTTRIQCPFSRSTHLHHPQPIDLELMKMAANIVQGTHDFRGFSNENHKGSANNKPIKTLEPIQFYNSDEILVLRFQADGFLYKMVRNITQTLILIGVKKIELPEIKKILESKNRRLCPAPAPAHGLVLIDSIYEKNSTTMQI